MAIFRVERVKGYTVMATYHLRDKNLSLKAKGLLSQMLSLPEDWNYTVSGLAIINKESIDAIRTAVQELEKYGYIIRNRVRDEKGRLAEMEYMVFEQPQASQELENPTMESDEFFEEKPMAEKAAQGNPAQYNIDIYNKDLILEDGNTDVLPTETVVSAASKKPSAAEVKEVQKLYENICKSYPKVTHMSEARKKAIRARLRTGYTVDDFRHLFEMAERSDFLRGKNSRNWSATFDWLICDSNMAKVLGGNYENRKPTNGGDDDAGGGSTADFYKQYLGEWDDKGY